MASMTLKRKIVGVVVEMTREEVYGLVNTAGRLGDLLDAGKLPAMFVNDPQAAEEIEALFAVSRAIGPMISAEFSRDER